MVSLGGQGHGKKESPSSAPSGTAVRFILLLAGRQLLFETQTFFLGRSATCLPFRVRDWMKQDCSECTPIDLADGQEIRVAKSPFSSRDSKSPVIESTAPSTDEDDADAAPLGLTYDAGVTTFSGDGVGVLEGRAV